VVPYGGPELRQQQRELALVSESEYLARAHARYTMRYDNVDA
jgi:hypothetical protein